MKIYEVTDPEFKAYGRVVSGYATEKMSIMDALEQKTPCPDGTEYVAEDTAIQSILGAQVIAPSLFGGLPVQFGWCNGHNTKLNCLEYHRSSEFNLGTNDFILLLALASDVENWHVDASRVKAFRVPAGVMVEVFATALHYAPCQASLDKGFRVLVALPKGTNVGNTPTDGQSPEDALLWASNKWLIAHPDSNEAKDGAWVGIDGENIDIRGLLS